MRDLSNFLQEIEAVILQNSELIRDTSEINKEQIELFTDLENDLQQRTEYMLILEGMGARGSVFAVLRMLITQLKLQANERITPIVPTLALLDKDTNNPLPIIDNLKSGLVTLDEQPRLIEGVLEDNTVVNGRTGYPDLRLFNGPIYYHVVFDGTGALTPQRPKLKDNYTDYDQFLSIHQDGNSHRQPLKAVDRNSERVEFGFLEYLYLWLSEHEDIELSVSKFKFVTSNIQIRPSSIIRSINDDYLSGRYPRDTDRTYREIIRQSYTYQQHAHVNLMGWSESGYGMTATQYGESIRALQEQNEAKLKGLINKAVKLNVITWQIFKRIDRPSAVTLGQFSENINQPYIQIACPEYPLDFYATYELSPVGVKLLGYYLGRVYKTVVLQNKPWQPLHPTSASMSGRFITIEYHVPYGHLVFDRDWIKPIANEGFLIQTDAGFGSIVKVDIIRPNIVTIELARAVTGSNPRVRYGLFSTDNHLPSDGNHSRGTVRDQMGDIEYITDNTYSTERTFRLDNYSLAFELPLR